MNSLLYLSYLVNEEQYNQYAKYLMFIRCDVLATQHRDTQ
jgi:hypothetical protein